MHILDIIFQSGDSYYQDSGGRWDNVVNILIAVFSLIGGFLLSNWYAERKENKRSKQIVYEFCFEVELIIKSLKKQKEKIVEFTGELAKENSNPKSLMVLNNLMNLDAKMGKYSKSDIIKYFTNVSKEADKNFKDISNLFENVSFTSRIITLAESYLTELKSDINEHSVVWDVNIIKITNLNNQYVSLSQRGALNIESDKYLIEFMDVFARYYINPDSKNIYVAIENLIKPLTNLRSKYISDQRVFEVHDSLIECDVSFREIVKAKENYIARYIKLTEGIEGAKTSLETILLRLNSKIK